MIASLAIIVSSSKPTRPALLNLGTAFFPFSSLRVLTLSLSLSLPAEKNKKKAFQQQCLQPSAFPQRLEHRTLRLLLHYDQILLRTFSVLLLLWPSQRPCACLTHPYPRKKRMYLVVPGLLKHWFRSERDPLAASW